MSKRKHHRYKRKHGIPIMAICAVIAINAYALHELTAITRSWKISMLPGNASAQLQNLAIILGINCVAIVYLLIDRLNR